VAAGLHCYQWIETGKRRCVDSLIGLQIHRWFGSSYDWESVSVRREGAQPRVNAPINAGVNKASLARPDLAKRRRRSAKAMMPA